MPASRTARTAAAARTATRARAAAPRHTKATAGPNKGHDETRRALLMAGALVAVPTQGAGAIGFTKDLSKSKARRGANGGIAGVPEEQLSRTAPFKWQGGEHEGLQYVDTEAGRGAPLKRGDTVSVHYDCRYRSVVLASSRQGQLLGGNRSIAQPFELVYGVMPNRYAAAPKREKTVGVGLELRPALAGDGSESAAPIALGTEAGTEELSAAAEAARQPLEVVRALPGSPAERAGVFPGERLVTIDGQSTAGMDIYAAARLLTGEDATDVVLEIAGKDGGATRSVTVTRASFDKGTQAPSAAMDLTGGGGLFTGGEGASKPPAAIHAALDGMRVGGRRVVRVTPDVGYLPELGTPPPGELPPGASFEMEVEVLSG